MNRILTVASAALLAAACATWAHAEDGVTDTEILLGSHTALSGPVSAWGVGATEGARMRIDEANEKGINGRKIRFIVEDSQYQVPRAVQAANKLINSDKIFIMMGALGTAHNNAVLGEQLDKGVPNIFPFTSARSMGEPFHKLKFVQLSSYYDQVRAGFKYFVEKKGVKAPCVMYQDTEFGQEILEGARDQAKAMNVKIAAESGHKPTDTDFTGAIAKLREAKCDLIVMGTIVRDTIIPYATARKLGWTVPFMGTSASYENVVATAQGGITEGYYSLNGQEVLYPDQIESKEAKAFFEKYKAKFGQDPFYPAQLGYGLAEMIVDSLQRAGKDLTTASFLKAFESIKDRVGPLGGPPITFTPEQHLGSTFVFLAEVEKGRWKSVERNLKY